MRISGATPEEAAALSSADELVPEPTDRWVRCVTVRASRALVYRRLCRLTATPHGFDIIDFFGRTSPEYLIPGAERLRVGQNLLIFSIADSSGGVHRWNFPTGIPSRIW